MNSCYVAQFVIYEDGDVYMPVSEQDSCKENPQIEIVSVHSDKEKAIKDLLGAAEDLFIMITKNHDPESVSHYDFYDRRESFVDSVAFKLIPNDVADVRLYNQRIRFQIIPSYYIDEEDK